MKTLVESLVAQALAALPAGTLPEDAQASARLVPADIERTRDARNGDFACTSITADGRRCGIHTEIIATLSDIYFFSSNRYRSNSGTGCLRVGINEN